ncbi:hypothetical protein F9279_05430 [Bacillus sp. B1-b2]|nr:hypothetical protein F9279_05430 [Bacillus sp. B1-b2]
MESRVLGHFFRESLCYFNINDFMISIWYMIGSISFLLGSTSTVGYWFFIIGSIQLSLRPLIRIIHFKKYRKN